MIAYIALGSERAAFKMTIEYVRERKAFGQRIMDFQNTRFKLAEIKTEIEMLGAFMDRLTRALEAGTLNAERASTAKFRATEFQGRAIPDPHHQKIRGRQPGRLVRRATGTFGRRPPAIEDNGERLREVSIRLDKSETRLFAPASACGAPSREDRHARSKLFFPQLGFEKGSGPLDVDGRYRMSILQGKARAG